MLSTGFLLSSSLLDLWAEDVDVSPAYQSTEGFPPAWIRTLCTLNPLKLCKGGPSVKPAEVFGGTDNKTDLKKSNAAKSEESDPERFPVTSIHCCHRRPADLGNLLYGTRQYPASDRLDWGVKGQGGLYIRSRLRRSLSSEELVRRDKTDEVGAEFRQTPWNSCCCYQHQIHSCSHNMGNKCCCPCCPENTGYSRVDTNPDDERRALIRGGGKMDKSEFEWEQHLLDETVMKGGRVSQAAIVSYKSGAVRATAPRGFNPDRKGLKNILRAMKGIDTSGLSDHGINLGSGTRVNTPGKLEEGKAIYGSDGKGGGCTVFKSKECVLIVFYESNPAEATRLASEVAEHMEEQGY